MYFWKILLCVQEISECTVVIASLFPKHPTDNYPHESNMHGKDLSFESEGVLYSGILIIALYVGKMRVRDKC